MNKYIVIVGLIVIAGIGYFAVSSNKTDNKDVATNLPEVQVGTPVSEESSPLEQPETPTTAGAGSYESYAQSKLAKAESGAVVLFFHASWCPTCRALSSDIDKNISAIPSNVTILKTDYDRETELKIKYGVTTQHTLVQVDKDGNQIKKWSGGSKLENLLSLIQ